MTGLQKAERPEEVQSVLTAIGAAVREQRKRRGLKLHDLDKRTGLSLGYLSQVELGRSSASIETLLRIAEVFGLTLLQLLQSVDWPSPLPRGSDAD